MEKKGNDFDEISLKAKELPEEHEKESKGIPLFQTIPSPPLHLKNWMENLPENLTNVPIWKLNIPGSHDSGSYGLNIDSGIAPDRPDLEQSWIVKMCKCMAIPAIYRWTKTQNLTVTEQLTAGIRYFDIRTSSRPNDDNLYFVHALYGPTVFEILEEINSFLKLNPKEIVFIDFQHFYRMSDEDHKRLIKFITELFGHKIVPQTSQLLMDKITLNSLWKKGQQVFVYYRDETFRLQNPDFWPSRALPNPWGNTVNIETLMNFLTKEVNNRPPNSMFVTQGVLTPNNSYVTLHFFSSLHHYLVIDCNRNLVDWLNGKVQGPKCPNIVMCDFIEWQNYEIPKLVIKLNLNKK